MDKEYCVHCGKEIDKDSIFCTYCGKAVSDIKTTGENAIFKKIKSGLRAVFNYLKNTENLFIKIVLVIIAIALWNVVSNLEELLNLSRDIEYYLRLLYFR